MKRALVVAAAVVAAACSPPLLKLPSGTGVTVGAADGAAALAQATAVCAAVRTLTAEIAVSGSAGGRRVRVRLSAGVAAPASVLLEAVAPFGPPLFIFAATGDDATLLLPRDERVLEHGRPDAVLEAIAGIPLSAADLEAALTGCAVSPGASGSPSGANQFGVTWLVVGAADGDEVYLHRDAATDPWSVVATVRRSGVSSLSWRAEYADRQNGIPRSIRLVSLDEGGRTGRAFDLRLALSQIEIDASLGADVFTIQIPQSAIRMTLDELRRSGVFGAR